MDFMKDPMGIERRSFEIIAPYLEGLNLTDEETKVYSRIIHASGDPAYASIIEIHPGAIAAGKEAIARGCNLFTDVEMVRTGVNKRRFCSYGGQVECLVADPAVAEAAKAQGITRSMAAMRSFGKRLDGAIVAVGNAPTALFEVMSLMERETIRPALIVGVPVGFVGAAESKEQLAKTSPVPFITVHGTKGGSPIAASVLNAILYIMDPSRG